MPLPITAYAACNALGRTAEDVIAALADSRSGLGVPPLPLPFETVCGALAGDLPAPPPALADYDTRQARIALFLLDSIRDRVRDAIARWGPQRVAIVVATSTGGIAVSEDAYDAYKRTGLLPAGYVFERQHGFHAFAELLRIVSEARGPTYVVSTACTSSGKVLASARRLIAAGMADAVLTGGVDTLCRTTLCGFAGLSVLSPSACRPFSRERRGINIGEGGALLLLERSGPARALLLAVGESSDAHHMSSPHPEGLGARLAMESALEGAGLEARAVDYINAHGTATQLNDAAEAKAIEALFGERVPVASTKGFTGHMLGAAGATEAVFAIAALEQGWIPANLGGDPVDPAFRMQVNLERRDHRCRVVMSNSFGFGGSNVSVIVGAP